MSFGRPSRRAVVSLAAALLLVVAFASPAPALIRPEVSTPREDDRVGDVARHDPDLLSVRFVVGPRDLLAVVRVSGAWFHHDVAFTLTTRSGVSVYVNPEAVGDDAGPFPGCSPRLVHRDRPGAERFLLSVPRRCLAVLGTSPVTATVRLYQMPVFPDPDYRVVDVMEYRTGFRVGGDAP